jgi:hypothetical protein
MQDQDKKRTKLVDAGEAYDKNGHWFRLIPARGQTGWLWVERWASDHRYRLVAAKSNMRVYRKEVGAGGVWHYVEIRLRESRLRVASWLEADTLARALRFFRIAPAMVLDTSGFWGIRAKRNACRLMNDLLARFDRQPILGSTRFHLADWDPTTWLLVLSCSLLISSVLAVTLKAAEFQLGLIDDNVLALVKPGGLLGLVSWVAILFYEKVVVRRWETLFPKILGIVAVISVVAATGWQLIGPTQMDFLHGRVRYHCVELRSSAEACKGALDSLPEGLRQRLVRQLQPKSSKVH